MAVHLEAVSVVKSWNGEVPRVAVHVKEMIWWLLIKNFGSLSHH